MKRFLSFMLSLIMMLSLFNVGFSAYAGEHKTMLTAKEYVIGETVEGTLDKDRIEFIKFTLNKSGKLSFKAEGTSSYQVYIFQANNVEQYFYVDYVKENKNLIMFYCLDFLKDNIYYIENYNAIAICEYDGEELFIQDVFMHKEIDLNIIINSLMSEETKLIRLGFTPINIEGYNKELLNDDNDVLYINSKNESIFNNENIMFPTLSHA